MKQCVQRLAWAVLTLTLAMGLPAVAEVVDLAESPLAAEYAGRGSGGGDPNQCDAPGDSPDVIVGSLQDMTRYGTTNGMTAFSIGTTSCNVGSCWLEWDSGTNRHPVIGQSLYRLKDGRMEHLGQSWLKHGFFALSETLCSSDCVSTNGTYLGVDCSDPYTSGLNGSQSGLGPKFQVNPYTGDFSYPFFAQGQTGNQVFKRVQVDNDDLDPAQNAGSRYFVEGHYITPDDAAAGNGGNNASYREVWVEGNPGSGFYNLTFDDPQGGESETVQGRAAIFAWRFADPTVGLRNVVVPDDGELWIAYKASDLGNGSWHYEYAIHNLNSHRGMRSFRVPLGEGINLSNIEFNDVDYHSGEVQEGGDWQSTLVQQSGGDNYIEWSTDEFGTNPNANALNWGTLYNFRFDADAAPNAAPVISPLGLFRPAQGGPTEVVTAIGGPGGCLAADSDGDSFGGCVDCNDGNSLIWSRPGEVTDLVLDLTVGADLSWSAPADLGGSGVEYSVVRSLSVTDFVNNTDCVPTLGTTATDTDDPAPGSVFSYLVFAENSCPSGVGSAGTSSSGAERVARECP